MGNVCIQRNALDDSLCWADSKFLCTSVSQPVLESPVSRMDPMFGNKLASII